MNDRQQTLLQCILESHWQKAEPVSSKFLRSKSRLPVSTATIRLELAELEEQGYIHQPHTSAGRVPTLKGVEYYLENFLVPQELDASEKKRLLALLSQRDMKGVAREGAQYCQAAAIIAQNQNDFYYTGFSQLLSQPEFLTAEHMQAIGQLIDGIEDTLPKIYSELTREPRVLIGDSNPLGTGCSLILLRGRLSRNTIFGFLGPVRTNYPRTLGFMNSIAKYI